MSHTTLRTAPPISLTVQDASYRWQKVITPTHTLNRDNPPVALDPTFSDHLLQKGLDHPILHPDSYSDFRRIFDQNDLTKLESGVPFGHMLPPFTDKFTMELPELAGLTSQPDYNNDDFIVGFINRFREVEGFLDIIKETIKGHFLPGYVENNPHTWHDTETLRKLVANPTNVSLILGELGASEHTTRKQKDSIIEVLINRDRLKESADLLNTLGRIAGSPNATAEQITQVLGILAHSKPNPAVRDALWFIGDSKNLTSQHVVTMLEIFFRLDREGQKKFSPNMIRLVNAQRESGKVDRDLFQIFEDALRRL